MKFTFENIGPIKKAELELGDLTVIAGKNNTGKTYIAYTLYGFLVWLSHKTAEDAELEGRKGLSVALDGVALKFGEDLGRYAGQKNPLEFFVPADKALFYADEFLKENCIQFSPGIYDVFSSTQDKFSNARISGSINKVGINKKSYQPLFSKAWFTAPNDSNSSFKIKMPENYYNGEKTLMAKASGSARLNLVLHEIVRFFIWQETSLFLSGPLYLSAQRIAISLFFKELDFAKNRLVDRLQSVYDESDPQKAWREFASAINDSARYGKPIQDNIDFTRDLEFIQKQTGEFSKKKIFGEITDMMGGHYRYANNQIEFVSKARENKGFKIPLHLASSSACGFSDLYFYLKHVAKKGQLLIIDEPETHLDTKNQILLARLLVRCVNAGIKVLLTTHSDYLIKELNNLIMLSNDFKEKDHLMKKFKYNKNDHLKKEMVKAYACENGGLVPCDVYNRGIKMPVFDDTIRGINKTARTLALHMPEEQL